MVQYLVLQTVGLKLKPRRWIQISIVAASWVVVMAGSVHAAPNVLIIVVQDLRASVAESVAWMPKLQEFRKRGAAFENAHAASTLENASRTSLWTGLLPSTSGVTLDDQDWRRSVAMTNVRTLPEHFKDQGYLTAAGGRVFYSNHGGPEGILLTDDGGGRRGYELDVAWEARYPETGVQVPLRKSVETPSLNETEDGQVVAWAKEFLARDLEKPFFSVVGLGGMALPRQIPKDYQDQAEQIEASLAPLDDVSQDLSDIPPFPKNRFCDFSHSTGEGLDRYGAAALMCDEMIAQVIDALDASPHRDNTLVLITSTRGAMLGEKRCERGGALWESATRVPLIVFGPGIEPVGWAQPQAVSLIDLYPTLCDWARIKPPVHLEGKSFRRCIGDLGYGVDRYVTTMAGSSGSPSYSIRDVDWHYIRYADGSEELYDHQQDHDERENQAVMTITQAERTRLAALIPPTTVGFSRLVDQVPQLQTAKGSTQLWIQAGDVLPYQALPHLPGKGLFLDVAFDYQPKLHRDAVLACWGTEEAGFAVFLDQGRPTLSVHQKGQSDSFAGEELAEGMVELRVVLAPQGAVGISHNGKKPFVEASPYVTGLPGQPINALLVGRVGAVPLAKTHPQRAPFDGTFQRFNLTLVSPKEVQNPEQPSPEDTTVLRAQPAPTDL